MLLRGCAAYERLEPDFVLTHKGMFVVFEVDGAMVHRESPVEAYARKQGLQREGVRIERVSASECSSRIEADRCAGIPVEALQTYRGLGA